MREETDATDPFEEFLDGERLETYRRLDEFMPGGGVLELDTSSRIAGHTIYPVTWERHDLVSHLRFDPGHVERLVKAKEDGTLPLSEPIALPQFSFQRECEYCRQSEFLFDGINILATEPCPLADGHPAFSIELAVPSGKIVYADRIPGFGEDVDINHRHGIADTIRAFEADGCATFFAGNTSPRIWRQGDVFHVAGFPWDEDADGQAAPEGYEEVGQIETEFWWCAFVDSAEHERRGSKEHFYVKTLEVEPGTYRFTYHGLAKDFDRYGETARFASLEKID